MKLITLINLSKFISENNLTVLIFFDKQVLVYFCSKIAHLLADSYHFWAFPKNFKHHGDQILERFQGVFKFHWGQDIRAKYWSANLVFYNKLLSFISLLALLSGDNKNELKFHFFLCSNIRIKKRQETENQLINYKSNHLNSFGWKYSNKLHY